MSQYRRTSITMPQFVAEELELRKGNESFSGQLVNDLSAYWEAARSGMNTLRTKFTRQEACFIYDGMNIHSWAATKLDDLALSELVNTIRNDGLANQYNIKMDSVLARLESISLLELLALFNWVRIASQRGDSPEKAATLFPKEI